MILVGGQIIQGCGHSRPRMIKFAELFRDATGETLHTGTLNVNMDRAVQFREHFRSRILEGDEWGWGDNPVCFEVCRIDGLWAYRINGGHGLQIAEIACSQKISKTLGNRVQLAFFQLPS